MSLEDLSQYPLIHTPKIPYVLAKQKKVLPLEETQDHYLVAIADAKNWEAVEELRLLLNKPIKLVVATTSAVERGIELCYRQKEGETQKLFQQMPAEKVSFLEVHDLLETKQDNPMVRMVNSILLEAIQQGASDVHFEPSEEGLLVRYRIDGVLHFRHRLPRGLENQMATRLKVMSKLDIAETRLPQDGRIKLSQGGKEIDFRVSTLPTVHGERIVLRILDTSTVVLGLEKIGMNEVLLQEVRKLIGMPEGIVLVTGPTGSGKTTTLYSAVSELDASQMNIVTIEDPVEYKLPGISQMNVNPRIELDFAKGLRHILRQDPDVIMVGEIRDRETAAIAIQASLTGHLVLSTLHTNDAPSALTRLTDMGIEPYLLASSVLGVIAQRLVRKICPHCKVEYTLSSEERSELKLTQDRACKGTGCSHCFHSGYRGRTGIYELMLVSAAVKQQVLKSQDAEMLRKTAVSEGMNLLFSQGVELVREGVTTCAEILRVTRFSEL